jgi:hypothetical protein
MTEMVMEVMPDVILVVTKIMVLVEILMKVWMILKMSTR